MRRSGRSSINAAMAFPPKKSRRKGGKDAPAATGGKNGGCAAWGGAETADDFAADNGGAAAGESSGSKRRIRARAATANSRSKRPISCVQDVEAMPESILSPSSAHFSQSTFCATALSEPEAIASAIKHLKESDAKLRSVIDLHGGPQFKKCESAFRSLLRSIVGQQVATKVADVIYGRLVSMCGGEKGITPDSISRLPAAEIRSIGISERKASYLHDLARNFTSGVLSDLTINLMDDEALMSSLTAIKGIGVWSVHMFMIFALHKPDVLPVGDLGIKKGFQKLYNLKSLPTAAQMEQLAACWRPYRSLGSWYMWRLMSIKSPVPQPE